LITKSLKNRSDDDKPQRLDSIRAANNNDNTERNEAHDHNRSTHRMEDYLEVIYDLNSTGALRW
jgi:hypothetical protein